MNYCPNQPANKELYPNNNLYPPKKQTRQFTQTKSKDKNIKQKHSKTKHFFFTNCLISYKEKTFFTIALQKKNPRHFKFFCETCRELFAGGSRKPGGDVVGKRSGVVFAAASILPLVGLYTFYMKKNRKNKQKEQGSKAP